jgi:hypothetical protein
LTVVGREDFEGLVLRNPDVGLKIISLFGERLEAYESRILSAKKCLPGWPAYCFG